MNNITKNEITERYKWKTMRYWNFFYKIKLPIVTFSSGYMSLALFAGLMSLNEGAYGLALIICGLSCIVDLILSIRALTLFWRGYGDGSFSEDLYTITQACILIPCIATLLIGISFMYASSFIILFMLAPYLIIPICEFVYMRKRKYLYTYDPTESKEELSDDISIDT